MAETAFARADSHATAAAETNASLRLLKNRLHQRFPHVKSSHLTEAIAAGLRYNSNAALRASIPMPDLLVSKRFDPDLFHQRLVSFGYELHFDFQLGSSAASPAPPVHYLEWLRELRELEKRPDLVWNRIYALRRACADEFAKVFHLGRLEDREDKNVARRWSTGVDHSACLPNWGAVVNSSRGSLVNFPGTDHRRRFYQPLPLSNGKVVEYESALVSMPYVGEDSIPREHDAAARLAGRLGWTCSMHNEWSWYAPGSTALVLFRRSTSHKQMLRMWDGSFMRWMVDHRSRLDKGARSTRRMVIEDIVSCQHLPLDLVDFEDCRERYLKEFAMHMYDSEANGVTFVFKRLMEKWAQETAR
jgi:hypothetical protein